MTDYVIIEGLELETVIGVYDWEREIHQRLVLDLEMVWDNRAAADSDDVGLALDYGAVSERVMAFASVNQPALLETLAEGLAAELIQVFGMAGLQLTLRKPGAVTAAAAVGVRLQRGQFR
ncbi:dihydroneopterin aldolase [uncultured Marinobacter sp.]|uniref:dihydroneopterin aldolase n=1 Tax=uncultured Marinobacter sp. TaxID=187379 RepID=UPI0030DD0C2B